MSVSSSLEINQRGEPMSLRLFLVSVATILWLGIVPVIAQDLENVQFTSIKAADNIYMLQGTGGNIGLFFGDDGVFLIDDQFAPLHEKLIAKIKELTGSADIDLGNAFLINTHFHGDHTGGNELLGASGAVIVAHENGRQRLTGESYVPFFDSRNPALPKAGLPVITFSSDITFHLNGDSVRVVHVSEAHTDGDAFVHFTEANVIHAGDILFMQTYPFIDLDNGGSVAGLIGGVEMLLAISDDKTKIIPGHGDMTDRAGLASYHKMLTSTFARVRQFVNEGKTLEQIQAAKPTAEFDSVFAGFISGGAFVGLLHRDLTE
jgi:glyoxylase-like metal-dependent hydrolase (beta-lactamase superfamily II)